MSDLFGNHIVGFPTRWLISFENSHHSPFQIQSDDGTTQRIGILRGAIADLERTLLSKPDDTTVKCATQLLKVW